MSFGDWVDETAERYREESFRTATSASLHEFWIGGLRRLGHTVNIGEHVYEKEWDILLLLDTCRWDVLGEVSDDYDFLADYDPNEHRINSIGSRSPEFIDKTFNNPEYDDEISNTAYVTANPHSEDIDMPERFDVFDETWKYEWSPEHGFVTPDTLTDRAIDVWRNDSPDRMIVHYMQPHLPYRQFAKEHPEWFGVVNSEQFGEATAPDKMFWDRLRDGEISRERAWEAYRDNLRWVLDYVDLLRNNVDADSIVISSDHGEGFGEWGVYGHKSFVPTPELKRVPWYEISGTDTGEYEPSVVPDYDATVSDDELNDRLRTLGYNE